MMRPVEIRSANVEDFRNRLKTIHDRLENIRTLLLEKFTMQSDDGNSVAAESQCAKVDRKLIYRLECFFIGGGAAAWLVGRTDEFDDIDIFVFSEEEIRFRFNSLYKYYETGFDVANVDRNRRVLGHLIFCRTPTVTVDEVTPEPGIMCDFAGVTNFINLFDTSVMYSGECRCDYQSRCTVTHNGCYEHGNVVYPLLFDSSHECTSMMIMGLSGECRRKIKIVADTTDRYVKLTKIVGKRLEKYAHRLYRLETRPFKDLSMSFLEYPACSSCRYRDELARKYVAIWKHKTYAPNGYGYKVTMERFESLQNNANDSEAIIDDFDNRKSYCICTRENDL